MNRKPKSHLGRPTDPEARAARRQQIMDGARACFVQKGFHASSIAMISEEAGVSIANIYQYFETKDDLIIALVEEELKNDLALIQSLETAANLADGLKQVVSLLLQGANLPRMVQLRLEVLAESFRNPAVAKVVKKGELLTIKAFSKILSAAQARGEIAVHVDPEECALLILAFSDGLLSRLPISPRPTREMADLSFAFIAQSIGLKSR